MKREILFRGKRIDNGNWEKGMLCQFHRGVAAKIAPNDFGVFISSHVWVVDPSTVGQYTGLTDKNGVMIFEGDILSSDLSQPYSIVIYKNGAFMLEFEDEGTIYYDIFFPCSEAPQTKYQYDYVIGNIHDNPELVKDSQE